MQMHPHFPLLLIHVQAPTFFHLLLIHVHAHTFSINYLFMYMHPRFLLTTYSCTCMHPRLLLTTYSSTCIYIPHSTTHIESELALNCARDIYWCTATIHTTCKTWVKLGEKLFFPYRGLGKQRQSCQ